MKFAKLVQTKRTEKGLTQMELAHELGFITPQYISNIERGVALPPRKSLLKLGKILQIDRDTMLDILLEKSEHEYRKVLKMSRSKLKATRRGPHDPIS